MLLVAASAFGIGVLEVGAPLVYRAYRHRPFVRAELQARLLTPRLEAAPLADNLAPELRERLEQVRNANVPDAPAIIHPYFGFVANPQGPGVNQYGFFQDPPLVAPEDDTVMIAIVGRPGLLHGPGRPQGRAADAPAAGRSSHRGREHGARIGGMSWRDC